MSRMEKRKQESKNENRNETWTVIGKILYFLLVVFAVMALVIVALQRFSNNAIGIGGFRIFNVISGSMEPKYTIGDILLSKSVDPVTIEIGNDVVYRGEIGDFAERIVTHEVVKITNKGDHYEFITKGLANDFEDPPITDSQIYGVVLGEVPILSPLAKILNNLYVLYFIIFVPITIMVFMESRRIITSRKESKKDKEKDEEEKEEKNNENEKGN